MRKGLTQGLRAILCNSSTDPDISAVAQLERDIIAERVKAGLRRARERGKRLGRPKGVDVGTLHRLKSEGLSTRQVAQRPGVSKSTVSNLRNKPA